MGIRV